MRTLYVDGSLMRKGMFIRYKMKSIEKKKF